MSVTSASFGLNRRQGLLGLVAFGWGRGIAASPRPVIRALVESWHPYLIDGPDGTMHGLDAELLQAICDQAGFDLVWVRAGPEWRRRRYLEFLHDRFDIIFSATPVPANADVAMYTRPYRSEVMMVAAPVRHEARLDSVRGFADLLQRRIPLLHVDARELGREFESFRPQLQQAGLLVPYPTPLQGLEMLIAGRAPLILGDMLDLQTEAHELGMQLRRQAYGYSAESVTLMLSRKRLGDADLARINQAIRTLEQNGALGAIRRRYGLPS